MHPSVLTKHMHTPTHFNPHHLARIFTLADFKQRCRKKRPNNSHNGAKTCAHVGGHLLLVRQCSRVRCLVRRSARAFSAFYINALDILGLRGALLPYPEER